MAENKPTGAGTQGEKVKLQINENQRKELEKVFGAEVAKKLNHILIEESNKELMARIAMN